MGIAFAGKGGYCSGSSMDSGGEGAIQLHQEEQYGLCSRVVADLRLRTAWG